MYGVMVRCFSASKGAVTLYNAHSKSSKFMDSTGTVLSTISGITKLDGSSEIIGNRPLVILTLEGGKKN